MDKPPAISREEHSSYCSGQSCGAPVLKDFFGNTKLNSIEFSLYELSLKACSYSAVHFGAVLQNIDYAGLPVQLIETKNNIYKPLLR